MKYKADYKNWVPNGMIYGFGGAAAGLAAVAGVVKNKALSAILSAGALGCGAFTAWCIYANDQFSYDGKRKLSRQIVEGTAEYVTLPEGGVGLDVGCGSGALTIACAKRNPQARMVGIDRWGAEYASFSKVLCEQNAQAEGVNNVSFQKGDACKLDFPDETFDAVTSNYVYHNITGKNKQELLRETLRVLKKGGTFAIHDLMEPVRYGDMEKFMEELKDEGYQDVQLIKTTNGMFMKPGEAKLMMLAGSTLLLGRK
ncbi:MAG: class I SAM-dependent methyltransferase [Oscillospiraceae bacterium]|nr:class I SAM-dependent methyltransferase [Oscillospiraceae bacterium]